MRVEKLSEPFTGVFQFGINSEFRNYEVDKYISLLILQLKFSWGN